jgi:hypothetical protein
MAAVAVAVAVADATAAAVDAVVVGVRLPRATLERLPSAVGPPSTAVDSVSEAVEVDVADVAEAGSLVLAGVFLLVGVLAGSDRSGCWVRSRVRDEHPAPPECSRLLLLSVVVAVARHSRNFTKPATRTTEN